MPERCPHERLDYLDHAQRRGWVCTECGVSGPTTVNATTDSAYATRQQPTRVRVLCVCGSGVEWPATATGKEVASYLAGHADCKTPGEVR